MEHFLALICNKISASELTNWSKLTITDIFYYFLMSDSQTSYFSIKIVRKCSACVTDKEYWQDHANTEK